MKYVVLKEGRAENFYVFNRVITHSDFAKKMGGEVVSAGFVKGLQNTGLYGESVSLKVKSREDDTERFTSRLGLF